jgi:membrane-associated phospholipid phosphatase
MKLLARLFIPVTILTVLCVRYVDRPVSLFVDRTLYRNSHWRQMTGAVPDILLLAVVLLSVSSYLFYLHRSRRHLLDDMTRLLHLIALALPASYLVKALLKGACGRIQTRLWLQHPDMYGFYWFDSINGFNGFPSGHMIVFTALFASLARYVPRHRPAWYGLPALLALLLVATNYHFVADVLFGAYTGLLVEAATARWLQWRCTDRP